MFDRCPIAINTIQAMKEKIVQIRSIQLATFQSFKFDSRYDAIIFRWCIGYLTDRDLIDLFSKYKYWLKKPHNRQDVQGKLGGQIIVFDNVAENELQYQMPDGQMVRTKTRIEALFKKAGLTVFKKLPPHKLHEEYETIMAWSLI